MQENSKSQAAPGQTAEDAPVQLISDEGAVKFLCEVCNRGFPTLYSLNGHQKAHKKPGPEPEPEPEPAPSICMELAIQRDAGVMSNPTLYQRDVVADADGQFTPAVSDIIKTVLAGKYSLYELDKLKYKVRD